MKNLGMMLAAGGLLSLALAGVSQAESRAYVDPDHQVQAQQEQQQPPRELAVQYLLVGYGNDDADAPHRNKHDGDTPHKADKNGRTATGGSIAANGTIRANQLMDKNIENAQGEKLGGVDNFVVSPDSGKTLYVVVRKGDVLGMGGRYIAVPWQALNYNAGRDALVLDMTRDRFDTAPSFSPDNWPDMTNSAWQSRVDRYYGIQAGGVDVDRSADRFGTGGSAADHAGTLRADKVTGKSIENSQGDRIARIDNFVVDTRSGEVLYAVTRTDDVMGLGGRYIAIPWQALDYSAGRDAFVLNMTKDQLKGAPSFSPGEWPDMTNSAWRSRVDRYFRVEAGGAGGSVQQPSGSFDQKHDMHDGDYDHMSD